MKKSFFLNVMLICSIALIPSSCGKTGGEEMKPVKLTFIGHASVKLKTADGFVIYIDPAYGDKDSYSEPADLILVTHTHGDHYKESFVNLKEKGTILAPVIGIGFKVIKTGETEKFGQIKILSVPAYNKNHDRNSCSGYVISFSDLRVYHSGDTSNIPEMSKLAEMNIDYAMLCTDGKYNMGAAEAKKAAEAVKAKTYIPIHTFGADISAFDMNNQLRLEDGQEITL